jgi:MFS family permease
MNTAPEPERLFRQAIVASWSLLLGFLVINVGHGLQGTLLSLRATLEGFATLSTGVMMASYYAGFLAGSAVTPGLVGRVGHIRVFAALTSLASTTILVHSLWIDTWAWSLMRFVTGVCFAGIYIVVESWLNDRATNQTRGRIFSVYMLLNFGGLAAGQYLLNVADPAGARLFIVVSLLVSVAAIPLVLSSTAVPAPRRPVALGIGEVRRRSPVALAAVVASGMVSGAVFGMGAVYATKSQFTLAQTSLFMSMPILGALLLQWPLGTWSDRVDRRRVIVVGSLAGVLLAAALGTILKTPGPGYFLAVLLLGGTSMPLYAIAVSHLNDRLEPDEMVSASSTMVKLSGVGAMLGPIGGAAGIRWFGPTGFFVFQGAVLAALLVFVGLRLAADMGREINVKRRHVLAEPTVGTLAVGAATQTVALPEEHQPEAPPAEDTPLELAPSEGESGESGRESSGT